MLKKLKEYKKVLTAVITNVKNPHLYFFDMFKLLKNDWIFETKKGKLIVRPNSSDKWVALENLVFNQFEFEQFAQDTDTVIDLGSNIGASALMAHKYFKNAKIYCFEPLEDNYKYLLKNIELNGMEERVECINSAVSDSNSEYLRLNLNYDSSSASTYFGSPETEFVEVKNTHFTNLEGYINGKTLLKMDIEGEEFNFFKEEHLDLINKFYGIILEYYELYIENGSNRISEFLEKHDYKFRKYGAFVSIMRRYN